MSKYMQIDIKIVPFYKGGFSKCFPRIFEFCKKVGYGAYVVKDKTLYELVDILESMVKNDSVPEDYRKEFQPYYQKAMDIKKEAREMLLSRKLNELDSLLYRLEDLFEDLDREIDYW